MGIRVTGKEELEERIYQYFTEINKVPVPYHWTYKLEDIDLEKEDISQIVYEVVNHKAARACDKDKRAPKPRTRNKQDQGNKAQQNIKSISESYTSQYKDWIGTNIQKELLDQAENPQLQNAIKQLYRRNSFIGDGGTADIIRFEQQTGLMLGKNGGSHVQKGIDMAKYIENKILTQDLSPLDRALVAQLLEDLYNALGR